MSEQALNVQAVHDYQGKEGCLHYVSSGINEDKSKPLSAMIESPGSNNINNFDFLVSSLYEM
jgi:hypothetical protein